MSNNHSQKLSVLIITLNEEENINALLTDLEFADEIIIIDSFSTDKTTEIASSFEKVTVYQNEFMNFSAQRNFAISKAKNDWILFLDADERLTFELKNEIIELLLNEKLCAAYFFERIFMFEKKVLRYSGNQTDKIFRLFNKNFAKYDSKKLVHEKLIVQGEIGILKNKLIHYTYSSYDDYKEKIVFYGKFKAQENFLKQNKSNFLIQIFHSTYNFLYNYIIRFGVLDGKKGITICYLNAYSIWVRYDELNRLWKENQNVISKT